MNIRILPRCAVALLAALSVAGCAAILNGSHTTVHFDSDPPGAKVYDNGSPIGTTPFEISLEKKKDHSVEFRKQGFENISKVISSSAGAGWIVCDILLSPFLVGVIVDAVTGSWNGLDNDFIKVVLEATKAN